MSDSESLTGNDRDRAPGIPPRPAAPEPPANRVASTGLFFSIAGVAFFAQTLGVAAVVGIVLGLVGLARSARVGSGRVLSIITIVLGVIGFGLTLYALTVLR